MSALTSNRVNVNDPSVFTGLKNQPVAGGVHIYQNALIAFVDGFWQPATVAPGQRLALAMQEVDNSAGADGDKTVEVHFFEPKRLFPLKNDKAGSPITPALLGGNGWIIDDQTVSATGAAATHTLVVPWTFYEANRRYTDDLVWCEVL